MIDDLRYISRFEKRQTPVYHHQRQPDAWLPDKPVLFGYREYTTWRTVLQMLVNGVWNDVDERVDR